MIAGHLVRMAGLPWLAAGVVLALSFTLVAAGQEAKPQILFTNVNAFDGQSETLIRNASVLVEDNLIKQVSAGKIAAPGAKVIDGGGLLDAPSFPTSREYLPPLGHVFRFPGRQKHCLSGSPLLDAP